MKFKYFLKVLGEKKNIAIFAAHFGLIPLWQKIK